MVAAVGAPSRCAVLLSGNRTLDWIFPLVHLLFLYSSKTYATIITTHISCALLPAAAPVQPKKRLAFGFSVFVLPSHGQPFTRLAILLHSNLPSLDLEFDLQPAHRPPPRFLQSTVHTRRARILNPSSSDRARIFVSATPITRLGFYPPRLRRRLQFSVSHPRPLPPPPVLDAALVASNGR